MILQEVTNIDFSIHPSGPDYGNKQNMIKNIPTEEQVNDEIKHCKLKKALRPWMLSMQLVGLFHLQAPSAHQKERVNYLKIYSAVIMTIIWFNFIRCFFMYTQKDEDTVSIIMKIMIHIWSLLLATGSTTCYFNCKRGGGWQQFFEAWTQVAKCLDEISVRKYLARRLGVYLICIWLLILVNMVFSLYCVATSNVMDFMLAPLPPDYPYFRQIFYAIHVMFFYAASAWIFPTSIVFFLSLALHLEFKEFHKSFQKAVSAGGEFEGDIEEFRMKHQAVCHLASVADDMTYLYNGLGGGLALTFALLNLTIIVWHPPIRQDPVALTFVTLWLAVSIIIVAFIFLGGGKVNHMAHAPVDTLYRIKFKNVNEKTILNVNLFLNRLSASPIGLSVLRMFVIDKPVILSVFGAFVTYFIVLMQFQQSTPAVTSGPMMNTDVTTMDPANVTGY